jgi:hypothetical protein
MLCALEMNLESLTSSPPSPIDLNGLKNHINCILIINFIFTIIFQVSFQNFPLLYH